MEDFNIRRFLAENKLTVNSKTLKESLSINTSLLTQPEYLNGLEPEQAQYAKENFGKNLEYSEFLDKFNTFWEISGEEEGEDSDVIFNILKYNVDKKLLTPPQAADLMNVYYQNDLDDEELYEQGFSGGGNAPDTDLSNIDPGYDFESDGPDQFQKLSDNLDVEDEDEDSETPAFDFESGGANSGYPVFEDDMYGYDPEKDYETMESAWADDEGELDEQPDISGAQGIYGAMKKAYDFDSEGPGKAGPYQEFSYESELDEEDDFEEVDEDIRESFLIQKNKINEMFNRFNKYN
jgi:hypothetical protein